MARLLRAVSGLNRIELRDRLIPDTEQAEWHHAVDALEDRDAAGYLCLIAERSLGAPPPRQGLEGLLRQSGKQGRPRYSLLKAERADSFTGSLSQFPRGA
ncbi:MAG TPA: hypothetical protein VNN09_01480 [Candidatus Competibacteraceae bacterium]|nr:hypothetical protein [Candidatus Competibacteraceae bacterium]